METLDISKYKFVGEFYENARKQGYTIPSAMCQGLSELMKTKDLSFQEAYNFLLKKKEIILEGKVYIYHLSASRLWENELPKKTKEEIKEEEDDYPVPPIKKLTIRIH